MSEPRFTRIGPRLIVRAPVMLIHPGAEQFKEDVLRRAEGVVDLVFDLGACEYIDSVGLGVLVSITKTVRRAGGMATLAALNPELHTLFEMTRMDTMLPLTPDVPLRPLPNAFGGPL
jgi:anti-sigma B factor antagonist